MTRRSKWLAWVVFGVIVAEIVAAVLLAASREGGPGSDATALAPVLFVLATASVGTLIGLRRPGNTIGWLLQVAAFGFASGSLLVTYVEIAVGQPESWPVGPMAVWLGDVMFQVGFGVSATFSCFCSRPVGCRLGAGASWAGSRHAALPLQWPKSCSARQLSRVF